MSIRRNWKVAIAVTVLALSPSAVQAAGAYTFTKVLETGGDVGAFNGFFSFNDKGQVALLATKTSGETEILVGDGGAVRTIADTSSGTFSSVGNPSINNSGTVVFSGNTPSYQRGIYADTGSGPQLLVNLAGYYNGGGKPSINNAGAVAFIAARGYPAPDGIFVADGSSIHAGPDTSGPLASFNNNGAVLNDLGVAAFRAVLDSGAEGIFTTDGSTLTTIADTSGPLALVPGFTPSINNSGSVAFTALTDAGNSGIFVGNGGPLSTIAETSSSIFFLGQPSINDAGSVVFSFQAQGDFGRFVNGIYGGPDLVNDAVILSGDLLDGSPLGGIDPNQVLINNAGQVAFQANFSGGRQAIYVASPVAVPEPSGLLLSGLGLGIAVAARRRRMRTGA